MKKLLSRILMIFMAIFFIVPCGQLELHSQDPDSPAIDTKSKKIIYPSLFAKLEAKIIPKSQQVNQGGTALFTSQSTSAGAAISRESWTGPGGQSGSGGKFVITTQGIQPGTYTINLTVTDGRGISNSTTATLVINPPPQPKYTLSVDVVPDHIQEGGSVNVTAILNPPNQSLEYRFDFGDQSPRIWIRETETSHTYNSAGEFTVSVAARRAQVGTASKVQAAVLDSINQKKVTVTPALQDAAVSLKPDRDNIYVADTVFFEAELNKPLDGARYLFIFGDSLASTWTSRSTTKHVYSEAGSYDATLKLNWNGKVITSRPVTILVKEREPVFSLRLHLDKKQAQANNNIAFTADLDPPSTNTEYNFIFGDKTQSNWIATPNTRHRYAEAGKFLVKVLAGQNGKILAESQTETVRITPAAVRPPAPSASLQVKPPSAKKGESLIFLAEATPPDQRIEYRFVFGDGNQSEWERNPRAEHKYVEAKTYSAYVTTRIGRQLVAESPQIDIVISSQDSVVPPIWIVIGAAIVFILGLLIKISKKIKNHFIHPPVNLQVTKIMMDEGEQFIGSGQPLDSDYEIQIRPALDQGSQKIVEGSLVLNETIAKEGM